MIKNVKDIVECIVNNQCIDQNEHGYIHPEMRLLVEDKFLHNGNNVNMCRDDIESVYFHFVIQD